MLVLQAVPAGKLNAFKLLRARIREASTWSWSNKARTRLKHVARPKGGHIEVSSAGGVLVAHIKPKTPSWSYCTAQGYRKMTSRSKTRYSMAST